MTEQNLTDLRVGGLGAATTFETAVSPAIGTVVRVGSAVTIRIADAVLAGWLTSTGGPVSTGPKGRAGTVHLVGPGVDLAVEADSDGSWTADVPAGTYTVTGSSPGYLSKEGMTDSCQGDRPVTVMAGGTAKADVVCEMK